MVPDPGALRALGTTFRRRADEVRAVAAATQARAEGAPWSGAAAEAAREATAVTAAGLRARADDHDAVALALDAHADAVAATLALVAATREAFLALAASVGAAVGEGLGVVADGVDAVSDAVGGTLGDVGGAVADGIGAVGDALTGDDGGALREALERIDVPPPGDLGWLEVDVDALAALA